MRTFTKKELKIVLDKHLKWLKNEKDGERADLGEANLAGANFRYANLERANLSEANLEQANLERANLRDANLERADLWEANLSEANLWSANLERADLWKANLEWANLERADLRDANLVGANLEGADLRDADLVGANLEGANLSEANLWSANLERANLYKANLVGANLRGAKNIDLHTLLYQRSIVPEEGSFRGYKKLKSGAIATLLISKNALRMGGLIGRKCRASKVKVLSIEGGDGSANWDKHSATILYEIGKWIVPDKYDCDLANECSNGIHFFITKKEAIKY